MEINKNDILNFIQESFKHASVNGVTNFNCSYSAVNTFNTSFFVDGIMFKGVVKTRLGSVKHFELVSLIYDKSEFKSDILAKHFISTDLVSFIDVFKDFSPLNIHKAISTLNNSEIYEKFGQSPSQSFVCNVLTNLNTDFTCSNNHVLVGCLDICCIDDMLYFSCNGCTYLSISVTDVKALEMLVVNMVTVSMMSFNTVDLPLDKLYSISSIASRLTECFENLNLDVITNLKVASDYSCSYDVVTF